MIMFSFHRVIQESFINMENMLELMDEPQEISDRPNAMPIMVTQGKIEFKNVNFHYGPDRPILKDISFIVNPGETVALVSFFSFFLQNSLISLLHTEKLSFTFLAVFQKKLPNLMKFVMFPLEF